MQYPSLTLGVHWRFSQDDWGQRCDAEIFEREHPNEQMPVECELMNKLNMSTLAQTLAGYSKGGDVYIAAPPSEWSRIQELSLVSGDKYDVEVVYGEMLEEVLATYFGDCEWYKKWKGEILSLVEQAILSGTDEFMEWLNSSWSGRVRELRCGVRSK